MAQLQAINSLRQADRRVGPGSVLSLGRGDSQSAIAKMFDLILRRAVGFVSKDGSNKVPQSNIPG